MFTLSTLRRASTAVRAQTFVRRKRSLRKRRATVFGRRPEQTSGMCKWLCASPFFVGGRVGCFIRALSALLSGAVGSFRMRKHPSKVFLVLFVHKKNSTSGGSDQIARRRLKREIVKMRWRILTRFSQAREQWIEPRLPLAHRGHAGPARLERSPLKPNRAPRQKKRFILFRRLAERE